MNLITLLNVKKKIFLNKENFFLSIFITLIFTLDRISKNEITKNFNDTVYYVNSFINFDLIWNTGIGFGLLSYDSSLIYNLVTFLVGVVILILTYITIISEKLDKLIYSIIIGGAIGNFYDRLTYNAVPDFIDLHYNGLHWFTFNMADIFITLGIFFFLVKSFFEKK